MFRALSTAKDRKFTSRMARHRLNLFPSTRKSMIQSFFTSDQVGTHGLFLPKIFSSLHFDAGREIGQFRERRRNFSRNLSTRPFRESRSMKDHMKTPCDEFHFGSFFRQDFGDRKDQEFPSDFIHVLGPHIGIFPIPPPQTLYKKRENQPDQIDRPIGLFRPIS